MNPAADLEPLMPEDELQALLAEASALTPDERVTRFLSRDVVLPHSGRTAVLITLDNGEDHTKPNTLGPRSLTAFNTALNAAHFEGFWLPIGFGLIVQGLLTLQNGLKGSPGFTRPWSS